MEVLGAAVECLDDSSTLSPVLVALGQMHVPYGVRTHYLPVGAARTPRQLDLSIMEILTIVILIMYADL